MAENATDQTAAFLRQSAELFGDEFYSAPHGESEIMTEVSTGSLAEFEQQIKACQKCALGDTRTNFVFGVGDPQADLVCVGEAPGADEDAQGVPFVGRAGKLLDKILAAIDLNREHNVYICNVLKCRPPNNRDPLPDEVEFCEPYLLRQLELIKPKLIVALGKVAAKTLLRLESNIPLKDMRNKLHDYHGTPLVATYHPAALLRGDRFKRPTWEDFKWIRSLLKAE